jgi:hypothetical protein
MERGSAGNELMRDEFIEETKRTIAARTGNACSNPDCRAATSGPQVDSTKSLNVGVAAHITGATEGCPRYDPALSSEERKHPDNGIWVCQTCGKLIDNDPARYPEKLLRAWKEVAEHRALQSIGKTIYADSRRTGGFDYSTTRQQYPPRPARTGLVFDGIGTRRHCFPVPLGLQDLLIVGVKNNLLATARSLHNVKARIDYSYDNQLEFTIDPVRWEENPRRGVPVMNALSVDLDANETHCIPIFMEGRATEYQQPDLPQSAVDDQWRSRDLKRGRWTVRLTISADNCNPLIGEIEFTIAQNPGEAKPFVGIHPPLGIMRLPLLEDQKSGRQWDVAEVTLEACYLGGKASDRFTLKCSGISEIPEEFFPRPHPGMDGTAPLSQKTPRSLLVHIDAEVLTALDALNWTPTEISFEETQTGATQSFHGALIFSHEPNTVRFAIAREDAHAN